MYGYGCCPRTNAETKRISKEVRKYFIECEEQLKQQVPQLTKEEQLVLSIYNSNDGIERVQIARELVDLKVDEAIKPLNDKIKDKSLA